jgi:hypothetical protein
VVEAAGIPTVYVSTGRDLGRQVLPPRSIFLNFPMGNPFGRPQDKAMQRRILMDALTVAAEAEKGGELVDMPYDWGAPVKMLFELEDAALYKPQAPDPTTGKQPG